MRWALLLLILGLLAACRTDETLTAYGGSGHSWELETLDSQVFAATANLSFPEAGRIAGEGPCNRFSGSLSAPYPWFGTGPLMSTRRACPELSLENAYFSALGQMTEAEVLEKTLILRNEAGREMVFRAAD